MLSKRVPGKLSEKTDPDLNLYPTTAEGTRYSEEFAVFLKGADGLDASYRPIVRALFHD